VACAFAPVMLMPTRGAPASLFSIAEASPPVSAIPVPPLARFSACDFATRPFGPTLKPFAAVPGPSTPGGHTVLSSIRVRAPTRNEVVEPRPTQRSTWLSVPRSKSFVTAVSGWAFKLAGLATAAP